MIVSVLYFLSNLSSWIYITEVYYDWYNEWIELYFEDPFSWDLIVKWAKSKDFHINLSSDKSSYIILWDDPIVYNISWSNVYDWLWLSISDTKSFDIWVYLFDWKLLDDFIVSEDDVNKFNNKSVSFSKSFTWYVYPTNSVFWNIFASPFIHLFEQNTQIDNNNEIISNCSMTWDLLQNSLSSLLCWNYDYILSWYDYSWVDDIGNWSDICDSKIIYIEKKVLNDNLSDNYLELWDLKIREVHSWNHNLLWEYIKVESNKKYKWKIELKWIWYWSSSLYFDVDVITWDTIYFLKSIEEYLTWKTYISNKINLSDSWETISLVYSWITIDEITYWKFDKNESAYFSWNEIIVDVSSLNNVKTNCFLSWDDKSIKMYYNQLLWDFFTPSILYSGNIFYDDKIDLSQFNWNINNIDFYLKNNNNILCSISFSYFKELVLEEIYLNNTKSNTYKSWFLRVSEINPYDDKFPEFIELVAIWNYSWNITIQWLWHWNSWKSVEINVVSWSTILLSDNKDWFFHYNNIFIIDSISLTNSWEFITIVWQDWQVMDKVYYEWLNSSKTLWFSFLSWDTRYFLNELLPSPWFPDEVKYYYVSQDTKDIDYCELKVQNKEYFYLDNSINLVTSLNWKNVSDNKYDCIVSVDWKNIYKCNPWYFKVDTPWIFNASVEIRKWWNLICKTSTDLNIPILPNQSCKEDYYKNLYQKWKSKYTDWIKQKDLCESNGLSEESNKQLEENKWIIKISKVIYNPDGIDYWNEIVELSLISWSSLSLSWFNIYTTKNNYLSWKIESWVNYVLKWSLWLTNKWLCITLKDNQYIYDNYCYSEWANFENVENVDSEIAKFLWNIKLSENTDSVCIKHKKQNIKCLDLKYWKEVVNNLLEEKKFILKNINILKKSFKKDIKQYEKNNGKLVKKTTSAENKLRKLTEKYNSYKDYANDRFNWYKSKIEKYIEEKKALKDSIKIWKESIKELKLLNKSIVNYYNSFISDLFWILYESKIIYLQPELVDYYKYIYKSNSQIIENITDNYTYIRWYKVKLSQTKRMLNTYKWNVTIGQEIENWMINCISLLYDWFRVLSTN